MPNKEVKECISIDSYKKKWRYRWLKRALRRRGLSDFADRAPEGKAGFKTRAEALSAARVILEREMTMSEAEKSFPPADRERIWAKIAEIYNRGIDAEKALEIGANTLGKRNEHSDKPISEFWDDYVEAKTAEPNPTWSDKHTRQQKIFYNREKNALLAKPLSTFTAKESARIALKAMFARNPSWEAVNTCKGQLSKIREFLLWIERQDKVGANLSEETIKASCRGVIPEGKAAEAGNRALTPEQARSLLKGAEEDSRNLCAWTVLKLFMGARTRHSSEMWTWHMFDLETGRVTIPRDCTKMKKANVTFHMDELPNLREWLKWAREQDQPEDDSERICPYSESTALAWRREHMNANKEIFALEDPKTGKKDLRKRIVPDKEFHNAERSAFMTYGTCLSRLSNSGVELDTICKVTEDWDSHKSYVDDSYDAADAKFYFGMVPDDRYRILDC